MQLTLLDLLMPIPSIPIHSHPLYRSTAEPDRWVRLHRILLGHLTHPRPSKPRVHDADADADTDTDAAHPAHHPQLHAPQARNKPHRRALPPPLPPPPSHPVFCACTYSLPTLSTASVVWSLRRICSVRTRPLRDPLCPGADDPSRRYRPPSCRWTSPHEQISPRTRRSVPAEVLSHHPACQPQFLKTHSLAIAAAPTTLTSPAGSHLSEQLSSSHVGRRALQKCHRLESLAMAPRSVHLLQSHQPILKLHPISPHNIPLSTGMCNARTHRSDLYAHGGKRHAYNPQVAHDILWCTHRTDYHPQFVHARRHCVSNSCAVSGGTLRRTELH